MTTGFNDVEIEKFKRVTDYMRENPVNIDIILKKERVVLNIIQRLSGIASTAFKDSFPVK